MEMSAIVDRYFEPFSEKYGDSALPGHWKTLQAILACRTPDSGELYVHCPDCDHGEWRTLSCGNRHCPKCQNHEASRWIDKQQSKLLPVPPSKRLWLSSRQREKAPRTRAAYSPGDNSRGKASTTVRSQVSLLQSSYEHHGVSKY